MVETGKDMIMSLEMIVGASQQQDEGGGREHHDFDNGGHAESHRLAVYHEGRTQTVERTKEHDKNSGKDKDKHRHCLLYTSCEAAAANMSVLVCRYIVMNPP